MVVAPDARQYPLATMRPIDRHKLIDAIGRHLQNTMRTDDIDQYLRRFGINVDGRGGLWVSSKWLYVKGLLGDADDALILRIARDLDLPVPTSGGASVLQLKDLLDGAASLYAQKDFEDALRDADTHPANAIGMASTTLESICKAILDAFDETYPKDESLPSLQKAVFEKMSLSPDGYADGDIKRILGGLVNVGAGIAALRTKYSTFHGKGEGQKRLGKRHARLAVNALATVGLFLLETYQERFAEEK